MNPTVIAVAGKGGTGKTTICGLLVRHLCDRNESVLAVDADPNSNLNEVLGVPQGTSLADIREMVAASETDSGAPLPPGVSKSDYTAYMFGNALIEEDAFDMLVMGRTQGTGCYCFINGLLKTQIDKFSSSYRWIVVDNEAGMEHISRGTLPRIDILLLISDCSRRGIQAAGRLSKMIDDLKLNPRLMGLIVNRAPGGEPDPGVLEEIEKENLTLLGIVPQDDTIYQYDCDGRPTAYVPPDSPVSVALSGIINGILK